MGPQDWGFGRQAGAAEEMVAAHSFVVLDMLDIRQGRRDAAFRAGSRHRE